MAGSPSSSSTISAAISFAATGIYQVKVVTGFSAGSPQYGSTIYVTVTNPVITTTFSPSPSTLTYNGSAQGPSANPNPSGANYSTTWSGGGMPTNAGSYWVQFDAHSGYSGSSGQYIFAINPTGNGTVAVSPGSSTITAGQSITFTASGGVTGNYAWGDSATGDGSSKTVTFSSVGSYTLTVRDVGDANHTVSNTASASITVNPSSSPMTALSAAGATYNGAAQTPSLTASPPGAAYNWSIVGGTTSTSATDAGAYTINWSATGAYTGTGSTTWTVAKANQTITFSNPGAKLEDSGDYTLIATTTSGLTVSFSLVSGPATINGNTLTFTGTGNLTVRASQAGNSNYNAATNVDQTFTVDATPTVPTGLASSSVTGTSFTLSWTASTDNVGVTGYEVFQNGTSVGTPVGTILNITGLSPNTCYSMRVRARDAIGNWSAQSAVLAVTTASELTADSDNDGVPDVIEQQLETSTSVPKHGDTGNATQLKITKPN